MVDLNAWRGSHTTAISAEDRAVSLYGIILRDGESIVVIRNDVAQAAQMVRVEEDNIAVEQPNTSGQSASQKLIVYGVVDHPTVTDNDLKRADRFFRHQAEYEIMQVIRKPGQIQAFAELKS